jgi:hypothetical protein
MLLALFARRWTLARIRNIPADSWSAIKQAPMNWHF